MLNPFDFEFIRMLPPETRGWVIRIIAAIVVFLVVVLLRRVFTWAIVAPLRSLANRTENELDDNIVNIVEPASGYIVAAVALLLSAAILEIGELELVLMNRLARSLIVVGVAVALFQAIDHIGASSRLISLTGLTIDKELMPFLRTGLRVVLIAVVLVVILQEWEYNVSGLIAGLGLGGLAFSLAAQDTVSNLFGFSTIVTDRPFVVGEYISADGVEGVVERVGVRSTKIRTLDQSLIIVPNNKLSDSIITNWSRLSYRRFNFTIGLTYTTTHTQMREFLQRVRDALAAQPVVREDTILVRFNEFSSSSLDVLVRCDVDLPDWGDWVAGREQTYLAIMDIVDEMGLSMAFPSRSLYVEQFPSDQPPEDPQATSMLDLHHQTDPARVASNGPAQQDEAENAPSSGV